MRAFQSLFIDDHYIAIEKPSGFHSHPPEDKFVRIHPKWNALGIAEKQFGLKLYPCHRLDKATSGILIFGKSSDAARQFQFSTKTRGWDKQYFALVRGDFPAEKTIETALFNKSGIEKSAITKIRPLYRWTHPDLIYQDRSRIFTLVEARPVTGRFHQIRRHLSGLSYPILGDSRHGDKKVNREFFQPLENNYLFLRFASAKLFHPYLEQPIQIQTRWPRRWHALFERIGFCALRD